MIAGTCCGLPKMGEMMDEIQEQEIETVETRTSKKSRKSRKSLARQIDDCLAQVDEDLSRGDKKPAYYNLRQSKLDILKMLLSREDEAKKDAVLRENEALKKETAAFKELNVTPEHIASLREDLSITQTRLNTATVNARNDAATLERQQRENDCLKKNLTFCRSAISDPLFAMRAFLTLKNETRDECLNGAKVRDWSQFAMMYPTKDALLDYLRANRAKTGTEAAVAYCFVRLAVEFGMSSAECEKLFQVEDAKRNQEDFRICQENIIREAREANLRQPSLGIAGGHRDVGR
jgi:hypothetical protein